MDDYFDRFPDSYVESSRRRIQTPSAFARSAFFYVQETGYLKLRESHVARRKNLESYLVVLVLSGSGILMYGQKTYELKKGSCFFLVWVHFNGCTSEEYYRYFSSNSLPAFSPPSFPELREKLESLLDVNSVSDFQAEITSSRLIVDILSILLQDITGSKEKKHPDRLKMAEVRKYLDEHYTEKFSLDDLSERFFISKYHLSREFHQYYSVTLGQYVISRRLTRAKKLLRFSDCTLEEIARSCGFYDASYLNRQFRKSEGIKVSAPRNSGGSGSIRW